MADQIRSGVMWDEGDAGGGPCAAERVARQADTAVGPGTAVVSTAVTSLVVNRTADGTNGSTNDRCAHPPVVADTRSSLPAGLCA